MSLLIQSWLASFQSLPLEGVGMVQWVRRPAVRRSKSSILEGPHWLLVFEADSSTTLPADFFQRLACFGNESPEVASLQYHTWLRKFQADSFQVDILGQGELRKQPAESPQWHPHSLATAPEADLRSIPFSSDYLFSRWDLTNKLVVVLTALALIGTIVIFVRTGGSSQAAGSRFSIPISTSEPSSLPYREIR